MRVVIKLTLGCCAMEKCMKLARFAFRDALSHRHRSRANAFSSSNLITANAEQRKRRKPNMEFRFTFNSQAISQWKVCAIDQRNCLSTFLWSHLASVMTQLTRQSSESISKQICAWKQKVNYGHINLWPFFIAFHLEAETWTADDENSFRKRENSLCLFPLSMICSMFGTLFEILDCRVLRRNFSTIHHSHFDSLPISRITNLWA